MGIISEFKEFATKGNVMDMAVGIIIGGAFGKIISSFVNDVLMPPIGILMGGVDFTDLSFVLKAAQGKTEAVVIKYGVFLQAVTDFLIVAFAIFMMIRWMNKLQKTKEEAPAEPSAEEVLLTEIRDLLKK